MEEKGEGGESFEIDMPENLSWRSKKGGRIQAQSISLTKREEKAKYRHET